MTVTFPHRDIDGLVSTGPSIRSRVVILDEQGRDTDLELPVLAGTVDEDETRAVRRTLDVDVVGSDDWSAPTARDLLDPRSGREVRVDTGIVLDSGETAWWPQGIYAFSSLDVTENADGVQIKASGSDRFWRVRKALMYRRIIITQGTFIGAAIRQLLEQQAPWLPTDIPDGVYRLPFTVLGAKVGADPIDEARTLAAAHGWNLRCDADGVARVAPIVDPLMQPTTAWWVEGPACVLVDVGRSLDGDDLINGMLVPCGSATWSGLGQAWDDDPTSPARRALIGERPALYDGDSTIIESIEQANDVASAAFETRRGLAEQVTATVLPDPRRQAGESVQVTRARIGVDAVYRITGLAHDLAGGPLKPRLGARRLLS